MVTVQIKINQASCVYTKLKIKRFSLGESEYSINDLLHRGFLN